MKFSFKLIIGLTLMLTAGLLISAALNTKKSGWVTLFDGKDFKGWHNYNGNGPVKSWMISNGALVCLGSTQEAEGSDLITDKKYTNFDFYWEWKMDKGSNSGVLYHVVESPKYHAPYETGPEYQMIDDLGWPEKLEEWQKTGCDYAMYLPNDQKMLKPLGEWNTSEIIADNGHMQYWLNGKKIVKFTAWTADWQKRKAEGKWKDYPDYGLAHTGYIALQNHGQKAYFRGIRVKEL